MRGWLLGCCQGDDL